MQSAYKASEFSIILYFSIALYLNKLVQKVCLLLLKIRSKRQSILQFYNSTLTFLVNDKNNVHPMIHSGHGDRVRNMPNVRQSKSSNDIVSFLRNIFIDRRTLVTVQKKIHIFYNNTIMIDGRIFCLINTNSLVLSLEYTLTS